MLLALANKKLKGLFDMAIGAAHVPRAAAEIEEVHLEKEKEGGGGWYVRVCMCVCVWVGGGHVGGSQVRT